MAWDDRKPFILLRARREASRLGLSPKLSLWQTQDQILAELEAQSTASMEVFVTELHQAWWIDPPLEITWERIVLAFLFGKLAVSSRATEALAALAECRVWVERHVLPQSGLLEFDIQTAANEAAWTVYWVPLFLVPLNDDILGKPIQ